MWLAAAGLISGVAKLVSGDSIEWNALLVSPIILALVSFATMLPFLILSFTNAFYRERLQQLLRLPTPASQPAAPAPPAPAAQASRQ
jgi:ABC-type polysaccharide/polyol phosphate export permease